MTGIFTGKFEIAKNRNSSGSVVLLQVRIHDQNDIQTVELMTPPGDDSIPPAGARLKILMAGQAWKIAIADQDKVTPQAGQGEKRLYSQTNDSEQAYIYLRSDGITEVNGAADFAVAFNDLKTGLQNQDTSLNAEFAKIATSIGAIVTAFASQSIPIPPYTPGTITTNIDSSKVEEVKLP